MHQSNFRVVGFTERPRLAELAAGRAPARAAARRRPRLGRVRDRSRTSRTAREALAAGADLVCFSGDKLLGGPQAGIVVGRADLVERLRRHPLQRALRADKLTLAALEGTLALYLDPERAAREVPVLRMLREPVENVRARAERLAPLVGGSVEETIARVGGGALPLAELPSFACAVEEELAAPLRRGEPPVVAVVRDGRCLLDCRTLDGRRGGRGGGRGRSRPRMSERSPEAQLWNLMHGALATRAVGVVADLRIADALADGPRPVTELARDTGASADSLHQLLRALAGDGVFAETSPGVFGNTEASELLRVSAQRDFAHLFGGVWHRAAGELDAGTGAVAFERVYGSDFWTWLAAHPEERAAFDRAMVDGLEGRVERLAALDWRGDETVVDVGGGNGSLLVALLDRQPGLRGIVFDLPETVRDEESFGDRIEFVAGSFFEGVPPGDVHVLSTVLHNWPDEQAAAILRTIRAASPDHGRLLVIDAVIPPGNEPDGRKWLGLLTLALFGGRERDEAQWRALFEGSGFEPVQIRDGLIEARCR